MEEIKDGTLELLWTIIKGLSFGISFAVGWYMALKFISIHG